MNDFIADHLPVPAIGILRHVAANDVAARCELFWNAGVELVEVTIESVAAESALAAAVEAAQGRSTPVGAGSVRTLAQLERAVELGAGFVVSPGLSPAVVIEAGKLGVPCLPAVATGTEIIAALDLGCTWLKAFPASVLGPSWIKAQLAPFPEVRFIATGGISASNARAFLDAGALAVGLGSSLSADDIRAVVAQP